MTTESQEPKPIVPPTAAAPKEGAKKKKPREERASARPEIVVQTLVERGAELPIGFPLVADGATNGKLVARPWTGKYERELGKRTKNRTNMAHRVSTVLATLFKQFGPHTWDDDVDVDDRRKVLSGMYSADIFYAYCYLRREALGEELKLKIRCGACRKEFEWDADLDTLEIHSPKKPEDLIWTYKLRDPVNLRGIHVKQFRIGPQRWNALENNIYDDQEMGIIKVIGVSSSICGFNDDEKPIAFQPNEMDEVSKYDLEYIVSELNERFWGPKMAIELDCIECKRELVQLIPWDYNDFFSISSR